MADEIEVVKEKKGARKPAPKMSVKSVSSDERTALVEKLEREDKGSKYIFQSASISDDELAAKGLERTEHKLRNDILCRTDRKSYEKWVDEHNTSELEAMQSIDGGSNTIGAHDASPKKPK